MLRTLENCLAPAKLNLFLHVVGQRQDGYHLLQTIFQLIDFSDILHFEMRADEQIRRTHPVPDVPEQNDLTLRAAKLLQATLQKKSGRSFGANITLEKKLPIGGGLGGGSSDAATTLIALNHLWQGGLSRQELMHLGLQLGADVPFFLFGKNAFGEGVGEVLHALPTPTCWFLILKPNVTVPTPLIFSSPELTRDTKPVKITDFSMSSDQFWKNDLEPVAIKHFPEIAKALKWLSIYGKAKMSGSGACVFCAFSQKQQADEVLKLVPSYWQAWSVSALQTHPMEMSML